MNLLRAGQPPIVAPRWKRQELTTEQRQRKWAKWFWWLKLLFTKLKKPKHKDPSHVYFIHIGGFKRMDSMFKEMTQHLTGIYGHSLSRPLQNLFLVSCFSKPFRRRLAGGLWIIALLKNPSPLALKVTDWWSGVLIQDFSAREQHLSFHQSQQVLQKSKQQSSHGPRLTVGMMFSEMLLALNTTSRKFSLCPQNIFLKDFGDHQDVCWVFFVPNKSGKFWPKSLQRGVKDSMPVVTW